MNRFLLSATLALGAALPSLAESWVIDSPHSAAQFSVKHMMVSTVRGTFGGVKGSVEYDPKAPGKASVEATVDVTTIDTREPKRDAHLKSADFFDVEKFPTMTFKSTRVEPAGAGKLKVTGDLTMHGVTKQVTLDVEGPVEPVNTGKVVKSGAVATAKISRKDFGLNWNRMIEAGGVAVGDEVTITIDIQLNKK